MVVAPSPAPATCYRGCTQATQGALAEVNLPPLPYFIRHPRPTLLRHAKPRKRTFKRLPFVEGVVLGAVGTAFVLLATPFALPFFADSLSRVFGW